MNGKLKKEDVPSLAHHSAFSCLQRRVTESPLKLSDYPWRLEALAGHLILLSLT